MLRRGVTPAAHPKTVIEPFGESLHMAVSDKQVEHL
jgi:hypothetical protein